MPHVRPGSTVVATDLEQLLPLLEQNIAANAHIFSGTCEVLPFEWCVVCVGGTVCFVCSCCVS